jgi:hypothetical protein
VSCLALACARVQLRWLRQEKSRRAPVVAAEAAPAAAAQGPGGIARDVAQPLPLHHVLPENVHTQKCRPRRRRKVEELQAANTAAAETDRLAAARKAGVDLSLAEVEAIAHDCRETGKKWTDPRFGHAPSSLFIDPAAPPPGWLRQGERGEPVDPSAVEIRWQPPEHFCAARRPLGHRPDGGRTWLYYDEHAGGSEPATAMAEAEVVQGSLGDCYLLCALAAVTRDAGVDDALIDEQFEDAGVYGVSLWLDGRWRMVWVDAFFPCYAPKAEAGRRRQAWRLIFAATADHKQIWPMVVEKAIAKVRGSYEGIGGGRISEALAMLTGDSRRGRACL